MNRRIPALAAVLALVAALAACGDKEPSPYVQITPVPTAVAPPTLTVRWETGGTPPTDPRERAVWDYNIEMHYASNTNNYTRPQLRASVTDGVIKTYVEYSIGDLYGFDGTPTDGLGVYVGPVPLIFQKVEHDPNGDGFDVVYYCEGSSWISYGHTAPVTDSDGTPIKRAIVKGSDGKWRVSGARDIRTNEDRCSLNGASVGYYEPEPKPLAPGTYSLADLKAPAWALPDEWREAVG